MSRKIESNKGLKLAGAPLAIVRMAGEWRPVIRALHRSPNDPEVGVLGRLEDLKPPQRRKVQAWIDSLEQMTR